MIPHDCFSSFSKLIRVTAWIIHFVFNCWAHCKGTSCSSNCLSIAELQRAEQYWILFIQKKIFHKEIKSLKSGKHVLSSSPLKLLNPFINNQGLLRVGGREQHSQRLKWHQTSAHHSFATLYNKTSDHIRTHSSPSCRTNSAFCFPFSKFHIVRERSIISSVTRSSCDILTWAIKDLDHHWRVTVTLCTCDTWYCLY